MIIKKAGFYWPSDSIHIHTFRNIFRLVIQKQQMFINFLNLSL